MYRKTIVALLIAIIMVCQTAFAEAIIVSPSANNVINYDLDIPSGYNANGGAYGLARLATVLQKRTPDARFVSATKVGDNKYNVTLTDSRPDLAPYTYGTFVVDIYGPNDNTLKEGYELWFSIFDVNGDKKATGHAYKYKGRKGY